jgi:hypothetical protein
MGVALLVVMAASGGQAVALVGACQAFRWRHQWLLSLAGHGRELIGTIMEPRSQGARSATRPWQFTCRTWDCFSSWWYIPLHEVERGYVVIRADPCLPCTYCGTQYMQGKLSTQRDVEGEAES